MPSATITKNPRNFIPAGFEITSMEELAEFFDSLEKREINDPQELEKFISDYSELMAVISDNHLWKLIKFTGDTTHQKAVDAYTHFIREIEPKIAPLEYRVRTRLLESPFLEQLDQTTYGNFIKKTKTAAGLYNDRNAALTLQVKQKENEFNQLMGSLSFKLDGKELNFLEALGVLANPDRKKRENIYRSLREKFLENSTKADAIFDEILKLRHQIAVNAGFENYRDYRFRELHRYEYSPEDCLSFGDAIKAEVLPLYRKMLAKRKEALGIDNLKPWDISIDPLGHDLPNPFENSTEMMDKIKEVFTRIHPYFGERLEIMEKKGHLDLELRKGKAQLGYNATFAEDPVPFIFMSLTGTTNDVRVMTHEGGHAIHAFLHGHIPYFQNRHISYEIAELASMSMELFVIPHLELIYPDKKDRNATLRTQFDKIFSLLLTIVAGDKFQQWIYTNPHHTPQERNQEWEKIHRELTPPEVDWSGMEDFFRVQWQMNSHIFLFPLYFIDYAMAQLGAIALYRHFKNDSQKTIDQYMAALQLGFSKSISETYATAGIEFRFDREYVRDMFRFMYKEWEEYL